MDIQFVGGLLSIFVGLILTPATHAHIKPGVALLKNKKHADQSHNPELMRKIRLRRILVPLYGILMIIIGIGLVMKTMITW